MTPKPKDNKEKKEMPEAILKYQEKMRNMTPEERKEELAKNRARRAAEIQLKRQSLVHRDDRESPLSIRLVYDHLKRVADKLDFVSHDMKLFCKESRLKADSLDVVQEQVEEYARQIDDIYTSIPQRKHEESEE